MPKVIKLASLVMRLKNQEPLGAPAEVYLKLSKLNDLVLISKAALPLPVEMKEETTLL